MPSHRPLASPALTVARAAPPLAVALAVALLGGAAACDDAMTATPDGAVESDAAVAKPKPHFACPTTPARKLYGAAPGAIATLAADETWTPATTYVVHGHLGTGAHALTVKGGTVVCFDDDAQGSAGRLTVDAGGSLRLTGSLVSHVTLTDERSGEGYWDGITLAQGYADVAFQFVDVYDASGADSPALDTADAAGPPLDLQHTTFKFLRTRGLRVRNSSGFTAASTIAVESYSLPRTIGEELPVLEIDPQAAGTLDGGVFQIRNDIPATARHVLLSDPYVYDDVTLRALGLPFRTPPGGLEIVGRGATRAVLTLEAGVTLEVSGTVFVGGKTTGAGDLVAVGTAAKPVRFTSTREVLGPDAGDWSSIFFRGGGYRTAVSRLDRVRLEYGGAPGPVQLFHCRDGKATVGAEVMIDRAPAAMGAYAGPAITNSAFVKSAGDGVRGLCQAKPTPACLGPSYTDPKLGNTFMDIGSGTPQLAGSCAM